MNIIISAIALLVLDGLWIKTFMGRKYERMIFRIQGEKIAVRLWCVCMSYVLLFSGFLIFVLPRVRKDHKLRDSLIYGGLYGLIIYGVYDFTAAAVLQKWNLGLAILDIAWGAILFVCVTYIASNWGNVDIGFNGKDI